MGKRGPKPGAPRGKSAASLLIDAKVNALRSAGKSYQEIANELGISLTAAKSRCVRMKTDNPDAWRAENRYRAEIIRLWNDGLCMLPIANQLGTTLAIVHRVVSQIATAEEIRSRRIEASRQSHSLPDSVRDEIVRLSREGRSQYQIAAELDLPRSTVADTLQKTVGPKYKVSPISPEKARRVVELYAEGYSCASVSQIIGIHPATVRYQVEKAGIGRSRSSGNRHRTKKVSQSPGGKA